LTGAFYIEAYSTPTRTNKSFQPATCKVYKPALEAIFDLTVTSPQKLDSFPPKFVDREETNILHYKAAEFHPWIFSIPLQAQVLYHQTSSKENC